MRKIVVISDTHIPNSAQDLPQLIYNELTTSDMLLHAGDIVSLAFLKKLQSIKQPVRSVFGNMDTDEVRAVLPQKDIIKINGSTIGLIHGYGPPAKLVEAVLGEFENVDAIVFGHLHAPFNEKRGAVLLFNPGSPTDKIFAPYNSFGILEIDNGVKGRIVRI